MDVLGRFYTKDVISSLLINNLETKTPKKILDLGVGDASLTIAAYSKWNSAQFYATEIEQHRAKSISKKLSFIKIFNYNTLNPNLSSKLKIQFGSIDVAICNPPYGNINAKEKYTSLFQSIDCAKFLELKKLTSEIVFFAHNVKLLKKNGELGIIVSDSLITGKEFKLFRETILQKFDVRRIIQLPDNVFNKTEARTHIIFLSNRKAKSRFCEIIESKMDGTLSCSLQVPTERLIERMDYKFHIKAKEFSQDYFTLNDIGAIITRGKFSYKELRESKLSFFHSTNFKEYGVSINLHRNVAKKYFEASAKKGDILMCRVGKRIVGKVAIVNSGTAIISDCIYKIKVPEKKAKIVLEALVSKEGQDWLKTYSHGVCSLVISKSDLLNFPIYNLEKLQQ